MKCTPLVTENEVASGIQAQPNGKAVPKSTGAIGVKLRIGRVRLYGGQDHSCLPFGHLLYSFNLEFFGKPWLLAHEHLFYLLNLRLSGVYKYRGDSTLAHLPIPEFVELVSVPLKN